MVPSGCTFFFLLPAARRAEFHRALGSGQCRCNGGLREFWQQAGPGRQVSHHHGCIAFMKQMHVCQTVIARNRKILLLGSTLELMLFMRVTN